jgi:hypothetical protein
MCLCVIIAQVSVVCSTKSAALLVDESARIRYKQAMVDDASHGLWITLKLGAES